jgi:hypothetical protein
MVGYEKSLQTAGIFPACAFLGAARISERSEPREPIISPYDQ